MHTNVNTILRPRKINHLFLLLPAFCLCIYSCSPTRKLTEGQYLLNEVKITDHQSTIDKAEIEAYIKQKPNRKIFGAIRFHLWLYNLANEEKVRQKKEAWAQKRDAENIARVAKGKKPKSTDKLLFGEWLMEVGEAPVIYDSILTRNSSKQIRMFLSSKGYFYNTVHDSVVLKRKRAKVIYTINAGKPYKIRKVNYEIEDQRVNYYVLVDSTNCSLKHGQNYDVDILQKERDRITRMLNNNGYFYFSKEFIYFKVDSSLKSQQLDITIGIKSNTISLPAFPDSLIESPHKKYFVDKIFIDTDFNNLSKTQALKDTLFMKSYGVLFKNKLKFRPIVLIDATFVNKGDIYQLDNAEATYKRLSELRAFRYVNVKFEETPGTTDSLNCIIQLNPVLKQSVTAETEGTNTGGNLGVAGSLIYQNKNAFRGAELFEARIRGGLEVQRLLNQQGGSSNVDLKKGIPFNTLEFGPEVSLFVPRFLLPFKVKSSKTSNPKTIFNAAYNFQQRPDYTRLINKVSLGYSWKESPTKTHLINPIEVSFVQVDLRPNFQSIINNSKNILIRNSYRPHLVTDTRYTFIYNDQVIQKNRNHRYLRFNFETSGNLLRAFDNIRGAAKDTNDSYKILKVPYSQYLRADMDFRYYKKIADHQQIVFRVAGGIGKTLANLQALPFEKSFYGGGANGIRAWQIRSLGPGSYLGSYNFDQIGDMQLEGNTEYRFKLLKQLNGALFIDAGNIWQLKVSPGFSGGDFQSNRFYKEIAIGSGIGARLDFSFFIIRFDLGIKVRDPQFNESERWVIPHLFDNKWKLDYRSTHSSSYSFTNFNLGIGYPF
jgi:outer membrane protein assembly factor BamA